MCPAIAGPGGANLQAPRVNVPSALDGADTLGCLSWSSHASSQSSRRNRRIVISAPDGSDSSWPTGIALVFVHGAMDRGAGMVRLTRKFKDVETIRYDRRGYGHADEMAPADFDGQVADLAAIVGERPVVLFGHSFGGLVVLGAAARHVVDVRAVCTYEVPTPWESWWPAWVPGDPKQTTSGSGTNAATNAAHFAEQFMRVMVGDARWEALPASTQAQRRREGAALIMDLQVGSTPEPPFAAGEIDVPTILSFGSGRHGSAPYRRAAASLAQQMRDVELHQLDGREHGAPLDGDDAIVSLLRRLGSRVAQRSTNAPN